jgi:hypothetical protein
MMKINIKYNNLSNFQNINKISDSYCAIIEKTITTHKILTLKFKVHEMHDDQEVYTTQKCFLYHVNTIRELQLLQLEQLHKLLSLIKNNHRKFHSQPPLLNQNNNIRGVFHCAIVR